MASVVPLNLFFTCSLSTRVQSVINRSGASISVARGEIIVMDTCSPGGDSGSIRCVQTRKPMIAATTLGLVPSNPQRNYQEILPIRPRVLRQTCTPFSISLSPDSANVPVIRRNHSCTPPVSQFRYYLSCFSHTPV
jgi:hypothetical protein